MITLGLSEESDAGVALVREGKIIFAVNEERLTRKKFQSGFPYRSLNLALEHLADRNLSHELSGVALAGEIHLEEFGVPKKASLAQKALGLLSEIKLAPMVVGTIPGIEITSRLFKLLQSGRISRIKNNLKQYGLDDLPFRVIDHHFCHAASAYYTAGHSKCLAITLDAAGDGYCSRVFACGDGAMTELHRIPFFNSIGYYYTLVTFILGFKENQQGKVTGLSARGDPNKALDVFIEKIPYNSKRMVFENRGKYYFYEMPVLAARLKGVSREDMSAAVQKHLEISVVQYIKDILHKFDFNGVHLALSGGVFANVLLNRLISRVDGVKSVFIHPHMGDGGLATGAALAMHRELDPSIRPYKLTAVYFGCDFTEEQIASVLRPSGFPFQYHEDIEEEIAKLLVQGKVVARFEGEMEYGPRALGHRSIIYQPTDPHVNDWLNVRLGRSEFMPFAPAVLEEEADEFFVFENQYHPAYFMTIVCDTTPKCRRLCPAIVHVDGTARPQIVRRETTPHFHKIISAYKKLTGIPLVVNTSFNMHEEPIVESPQTALDAFSRGHLDYLAIGPFLVKGKTS